MELTQRNVPSWNLHHGRYFIELTPYLMKRNMDVTSWNLQVPWKLPNGTYTMEGELTPWTLPYGTYIIEGT